jgi:Ca-activated chloride channel family protein
LQAQGTQRLYQPEKTRILFLLDGSGSMKEEWNGVLKFDIAKTLLKQAVDSISKEHNNIEFGLRVFGHQSHRNLHDCEDSKLEVLFGPKNARKVGQALDRIEPKGYTPIALSLFLAANDFPNDKKSTNIIILITDGLENCDGDPCATSESLRNKRVSLKPYIIGLGLKDYEKGQFDCVGTYYDAADEQKFNEALNVVVSQALNNTTVQINLLDNLGRSKETNVEITLYDAYSAMPLYNVVHTLLKNGAPDTLYLDPSGRYNITAHTTPPVSRRNVELIAGKHNIIALDAPQGELKLTIDQNPGFSDIKCLVRNTVTGEIVYVQNFNTSHKYIAGTYDVEILTLPRKMVRDYQILPGLENKLVNDNPGKLTVQTYEAGILGVYMTQQNRMVKIWEWKDFSGKEQLELLPGEYTIVFRPSRNKKIDNTLENKGVVYSGKNTVIRFAN